MKLYRKDGNFSTYQVEEDWEEFEDEIVETPIGTQLKSYTLTKEYADRIAKKQQFFRIEEIKTRLSELSNDFMQVELGAVIDDLEDRKAEFKELHNQLRILMGKSPRIYE